MASFIISCCRFSFHTITAFTAENHAFQGGHHKRALYWRQIIIYAEVVMWKHYDLSALYALVGVAASLSLAIVPGNQHFLDLPVRQKSCGCQRHRKQEHKQVNDL